MHSMWFRSKSDACARPVVEAEAPSRAENAEETRDVEESGLLKTLGWISAGLGAVALGLIVGREIRQRYKFNRRTPYDLYSHSGDAMSDVSDVEFGVGI
jgi:hypothetical protein